MDDEIRTTAEAAEAEVLPRRYEVHCEGEDCPPDGEQPIPASVTQKPLRQKSPAEWAYERLILYIKNFEEQLDNEHEVAMGFTGGDTGVIRIEGMGYFDPDIVTFYGTDPLGSRTQLIQHVTQLSVMLRTLPKQVESAKPRRIGFRLARQLEEGDDT